MKVHESREMIGKEVPWLLPMLTETSKDFTVQVIDLETLKLKPQGVVSPRGIWGKKFDWIPTDEIFIVDELGSILAEVGLVKTMKVRWGFDRHWEFPFIVRNVKVREERVPWETVEQALNRVFEGPSLGAWGVRYIVQFFNGRSRVILHKLPKHVFSLRLWLVMKAEEHKRSIAETLQA